MSARNEVKAILVVFALTAIATVLAQVLPAARQLAPLGLLLDVVPLAGAATATALAIPLFRRLAPSPIRLLNAVYAYLAGGIVGAFGAAHTAAVTLASIERARGQQFVYDYRFYSLILLGAVLIAGGLLATLQAASLARGQPAGWRASVTVWAAILAVNLPLVPLQGFAVLFSALATVALLLLAGTKRSFDVDPRSAGAVLSDQ